MSGFMRSDWPASRVMCSAGLGSPFEFFAFVSWARIDVRHEATQPWEVHVRERGHVVAIVCFEDLDDAMEFWMELVSSICADAAAGWLYETTEKGE